MKKITAIILALIFALSMSIISYGETPKREVTDLKGATAVMVDEIGNDRSESFVFITGDDAAVSFMFHDSPLYELINGLASDENEENKNYYIMGIYFNQLKDGEGDETIFRIKPQIKGFDNDTKFYLALYDDTNQLIGAEDSEAIKVENGEIVGTCEFEEMNMMVLIIDKTTLSPDGIEPEKDGNELNLFFLEGTDATGNPAKLFAFRIKAEYPLMFSGIDEVFSSLIDNEHYRTMLDGLDASPTEKDLKLLERMTIMTSDDNLSYPVTLNLDHPDIIKSTLLYPIHGKGETNLEKTDWEFLKYTSKDGGVSLEFDSFSPVALYADSTTLRQDQEPVDKEPVDEKTPTSPITGESYVVYAILMGIMSIMAMVYMSKKEFSK